MRQKTKPCSLQALCTWCENLGQNLTLLCLLHELMVGVNYYIISMVFMTGTTVHAANKHQLLRLGP